MELVLLPEEQGIEKCACSLSLCHLKTQQEDNHLKFSKSSLIRNTISDTLVLEFTSSRIMGNKCICLSHSVYESLLQQLEQTKTIALFGSYNHLTKMGRTGTTVYFEDEKINTQEVYLF